MAFLGVLSTMLVDEFFVRGRARFNTPSGA
jgi:hypothetical protein